MLKINVNEAKTHLSKYLQTVIKKGQSILICKRNSPVAEIRPIDLIHRQPRKIGLAKGQIKIHKDFFDRLPNDLERSFSGE